MTFLFLLFSSVAWSSEYEKFNTKNIIFSKSSIPYLEKFPNLGSMNIYNNKLKTLLATLQCSPKKKLLDSTFWDVYIGIGFVSENLISLKVRSDYNCDSLAPVNNRDNSLTYDFKTRRVLKLRDIFLKKENTYKVLRASIYKAVSSDSCKEKLSFYIESESLIKEYLAFSFGKEKMLFQLLVPDGLRSCIKDFSISYKILLKSTSHSNILKLVAAGSNKK